MQPVYRRIQVRRDIRQDGMCSWNVRCVWRRPLCEPPHELPGWRGPHAGDDHPERCMHEMCGRLDVLSEQQRRKVQCCNRDDMHSWLRPNRRYGFGERRVQCMPCWVCLPGRHGRLLKLRKRQVIQRLVGDHVLDVRGW